ncbi:MAG: uroporphyrinogen-III C-methyltransferase [Nitrospirae bacterium]|nr:uroporphyrinogen-III C-methyltransferase [Nitrospirota bacterium]MCL5978784.1 uroporphyrinogen-III C-methyltransferase [Nitrospirota bacterium]
MKKGKVYLIGAGPGDIGLLTIKGFKCLQKAEAVVYDFHLNAQILNYINHEAEFIYAGKRGGHHAMTQDEINQALVNKAKEGKIVCRLKGGDPFVFGRGGEEAEELVKEGIEFEIIPGVSSSIAAPAYAGIPLTHRKYSSSFAVITGNEDITKPESTIEWAKLACGFDTLVFLMGVKNLSAITSKLIEHGKSPDTPAAVVRWGTRPDMKTVVSNLKNIADIVKEKNVRPPAVMIVGNVVTLRDTLKWYENKPLFGHRILVTREYTEDYAPLEDLGAEIFEFPTIKIAPPESYQELDDAITRIESYNWLIFTSANGFKYFMQRLLDKGKDIRDLKGIKICAIGTKTAEKIKNYGIKVDLVPEEFNAEGLIEAFCKVHAYPDTPIPRYPLQGIKFLLPRAEVARELFPQKVRELGGEIDTPVAYRAIKPEKHGKRLKRFLKEGRITIATFTSAATFHNFVDIMGDGAIDFLKGITIAAIGPVTAKAVEKEGLKVSIMPEEATIKAMVDEIIKKATQH